MARLTDIIAVGRDETIREMRSEIRLLARTIAAVAEEGSHEGAHGHHHSAAGAGPDDYNR
jgi:hypothetical protein